MADRELELDRLRPKQDRLDEKAEKILQFLFKANTWCTHKQVLTAVGFSEQETEYHLWELKKARMADAARDGVDIICRIMHEGTGYVLKHKLV